MKTCRAGIPSKEREATLRAKVPWPHVSTAALLVIFAVTSAPLGAQGALDADTRSKQLNQLFLDFSIASRSLFPIGASANGWRRYDDQFAVDISEEHRQKQREWCGGSLKALAEFDRSKLSEHDTLSYDVFRYNLDRCLERLGIDFHLLPVEQSGWSMPATFPILGSGKGAHPFRTVRDYDNFLKRAPGFVEWTNVAIANMRRGIAIGYTQPRVVMQSVLPQLTAMIVEDVSTSPFYQPILNMPETIAAPDRERLTLAYETLIREQLVPAYRRLHDFIRDEYLPKSRTEVGLSALPGGAKLYEWHIRSQTTLALTSTQIMDLGRRELERVRSEIEALRRTSGFNGDVHEWARKLRAETIRYASHADAIQAYQAMHGRVYERVQQVFGRLPRTPYEIRAVESYREASAASQYWRAGGGRPAIFYANLRAINREPSPVYVGLFLHETLPGHHLQIALAQENTALPSFRRVGNYAGFSEGWARYAEWLGLEMDLYDDPYQRLIWLHNDLFSAARLIIDVGLHAQGWTRERAIKFLEDNTLSRELFADYEQGLISVVERAISLPAYATAYKVGELRFRELRRRAEAELGPRFDVRAFHDELLKDGAMPLDILRAKMERWIANQKAGRNADAG